MSIKRVIYSYLMHIGMTENQSLKSHPFNVQNVTVLFFLTIFIICPVLYMIYGTTNLKEYSDCAFLISTVITATLTLAFVNWKMVEIFGFIDNLENIIEASKWDCPSKWNLFFHFLSKFFPCQES